MRGFGSYLARRVVTAVVVCLVLLFVHALARHGVRW